ncbi:GNAT family N-acetyltransferase [Lysinibacter cavernae]|uniref:GNAT superfamily N-acetyltransferase n=1 Tax=Lysinibacter cavernae TaxID=1640652 RepID=A0A7X5QYM8_9MICO|nr:GNAT family N-acetyltransferase [Lysinibacter cavernae]NIH52413.1 GNAT superfamily N-acetyltransferase [Lysinibacter cavernae]
MHNLTAETLPDGAVLRTARPEDVPGILHCIQELAVYEKEPDAVENTSFLLTDVLFGEAPSVYAHVVERDGTIVGIAVWFRNYSTWTGTHGIYLEDLFVLPEHRGAGYGKILLRSLATLCAANGYRRLEWSVLDWNEPSIAFYRSVGAVPMDGWSVFRLDGDALGTFGAATASPPA